MEDESGYYDLVIFRSYENKYILTGYGDGWGHVVMGEVINIMCIHESSAYTCMYKQSQYYRIHKNVYKVHVITTHSEYYAWTACKIHSDIETVMVALSKRGYVDRHDYTND